MITNNNKKIKSVNSKYKFFGGFGFMIGLKLLGLFVILNLLANPRSNLDIIEIINNKNSLFGFILLIGLITLIFIQFITQCKLIKVDINGITLINPLFHNLRNTKQWTDFDYFILVEEATENDTYEAIWLVKDGKIKVRISSFYYSNYIDLKKQIKLKSLGIQHIGKLSQLLHVLGLTRIKL